MVSSTIFSKKIIKTRSKIKLIFRFIKSIIRRNFKLFLMTSILAVLTAIVNFNISTNVKNLTSSFGSNKENILQFKNFTFSIKVIGFGNLIEKKNLTILQFGLRLIPLTLIIKPIFSLLHYYSMSFSYDEVEKNLKKDLFKHFVRAKYQNSSRVARDLIAKFSSDLDLISYHGWFIPNRLIYVFTAVSSIFWYDFKFNEKSINFGEKAENPIIKISFSIIISLLFFFLSGIEVFLFKKAIKVGVDTKKRYEEDNKMIYERINNIFYIKSVSGENYEEKKVNNKLDETFSKNKLAIWYNTLFKAFPNHVVMPNIPHVFSIISLSYLFWKNEETLSIGSFIGYLHGVQRLNGEVNKIIDAMLSVDELSNNLTLLKENLEELHGGKKQWRIEGFEKNKLIPYEGGDLVFENVFFSYPERSYKEILSNFSFRFERGKIYGVSGKNGIGKSTITKTTLKIYDIEKGSIKLNDIDIKEIDTKTIQDNICLQTNRPNFFNMSIAENVFYPYVYNKETDYKKLVNAAEKSGITNFIKKLPLGFDTQLKEGGFDLSEGQKQQISAMRIFIRKYNIYILDEILSNVYSSLKTVLLKNIFNEIGKSKEKICIVIDHHREIFDYVDGVYKFTGKDLIRERKKRKKVEKKETK